MRFPISLGLALVALHSLGAVPLKAETPDPVKVSPPSELETFADAPWHLDAAHALVPVRFGAEAIASSPLLDFRRMTPRSGFGGALFMEENLNETAVIQTRIEYVAYRDAQNIPTPNAFPFLPPNVQTLSANSASLGVTIRKYLPYHGFRKLYVLGGLAGVRYEFTSASLTSQLDVNGIPYVGEFDSKTKTSTKLGLVGGVGCALGGGVALEGRYTSLAINGCTFSTLQTGLSIRF